MELYLVRHGKIEVSGKIICYGQTDYNPRNSLPKEAEFLQSKLVFDSESIIYSSPLKRCVQLVKQCGITAYTLEDRLKEVHCGRWETIPWREIPHDEFKLWEDNIIHEPFPEGESYMDLYTRVVGFLEEILAQYRNTDKKVFFFCHGGVIRALLAYVLNIDLKDSFKISMDYGKYAHVTYKGEMITLRGFNF